MELLERFRGSEPLGRRIVAAVGKPFGRVPKPRRRPSLRWAHLGFCVAGLALGLIWALPLEDVTRRCPPAHEGLVQCQLQKSVLPAVMIVIGCLIAGQLLFVLLFDRVPEAVRAYRRGERWHLALRSHRPAPPQPDAVLVAATWGTVQEQPETPSPGTLGALIEEAADKGASPPAQEPPPPDPEPEPEPSAPSLEDPEPEPPATSPVDAEPEPDRPVLPAFEPVADPAAALAAATRGHAPQPRATSSPEAPRLAADVVPRFCRHNRFIERCPICSPDEAELATPARPRASTGTATRRSSSRRGTGMRVRRTERPVADGYANGLVSGLRATPDARRLADEIAFAAGRLVELEADPPGLYAEVAESPAAEEALWLAFLTAYLSPTEDDDPFAAIRHARTYWSTGALPDLDGVALGPRTAHEPERGTATLEAYRAWAERAGGQLEGLRGEPGWGPERRFERAFERLSLPGFHRCARMDFLAIAGRVGVVDMLPGSLHLRGSDPTTVAAKRVFGIGEPMLLERRARALADGVGVPLEALDVALYNFGAVDRRATLGASETAAERVDRSAIDAALELDVD